MLDRLLESKSRRARSPVGIATSVTAHLAIIVIAVHATAQSRPRAAQVPRMVIIPFVPKAPPPQRTAPASSLPKIHGPPLPHDIRIRIDTKLPPIDLTPALPTSITDFTHGVESGSIGSERTPGRSDETFSADQVEKQVSLLAGAPVPSYPDALRAAGVEGKVIAQFTVDERGFVERDSVRFVLSDNALFEASVRKVLARMRFAPAEIGGRKVRQLVQMPFVFTIAGR
jgi:protein TonB